LAVAFRPLRESLTVGVGQRRSSIWTAPASFTLSATFFQSTFGPESL
jgi:hypothetical protein